MGLNRYSGSDLYIPWHSDDESLFGPQYHPKLIVSVSLGHSVEFQVRRAPRGVPSPFGHGDVLVMDRLAQSEYEHLRMVSGLQGPRVNLTFRWVTQHIASYPLCNVLCPRVCKVQPRRILLGRGKGKVNGVTFG